MRRTSDLRRIDDGAALVRARRLASIEVKRAFTPELDAAIARAASLTRGCLARGGRVFALGNGGSAADAQHFVAELVGRFRRERASIPAVALTTNTSCLSAIGNDYGFEQVFARQLEGWIGPEDVVFALSTSGTSPNVLAAAELARARDATLIALTGAGGGRLGALSDVTIAVPSADTPRIQEAHILALHCIAELVEAP